MSTEKQQAKKQLKKLIFEMYDLVEEHHWDQILEDLKSLQLLVGHIKGLEKKTDA